MTQNVTGKLHTKNSTTSNISISVTSLCVSSISADNPFLFLLISKLLATYYRNVPNCHSGGRGFK